MRHDAAFEVEAFDPLILMDFLMININLSKTRLKETMKKGAVWLTRNDERQRIRRAMTDLKPGDIIEIFYDEALLTSKIEAECVFQNEFYSIWSKPTGMATYGNDWGDHNSLMRQIELTIRNADLEYRLIDEIPTTARGLVIVSHARRSRSLLLPMFEAGDVEMKLRLLIHGQPVAVGETFSVDDYQFVLKSFNPKANTSVVLAKIRSISIEKLRRKLAKNDIHIVGDHEFKDEAIDEHISMHVFVSGVSY